MMLQAAPVQVFKIVMNGVRVFDVANEGKIASSQTSVSENREIGIVR